MSRIKNFLKRSGKREREEIKRILHSAEDIEKDIEKKMRLKDLFKHRKKEGIKHKIEKPEPEHIERREEKLEMEAEIEIKKPSPRLKGVLYRKIHERVRKKEILKKVPKTKAGRALAIRRLRREEYPSFFIVPIKQLITIPTGAEKIIYPLIKPYAYANIRLEDGEMVYRVIEPKLSDEEKAVFEKLKEGLIQVIDISFGSVKNKKEVLDFLEERVRFLINEYGFDLSDEKYMKMMYYIYRDFVGLNEIEPLLNDLYIEDISCDGIGIPVYVVHQKFGSMKTNITYGDEKYLREFVIKLSERCDRYISYAEPLLDGSLPDGTRVHASLAKDVTTRGPTFTIRKFPEKPFSPVEMVNLKTASPEMLAYLWYVIDNGANILIAGGTATGKTSFLNTISLFILPENKIVSIEDTRELNLPHENWVPGVARSGFPGTKAGEVTMYDLLRESFRQNPDYIIVGEVRGEEASVMFQAMASGISSMATMHSGSVDDVLKRLQTRPINLAPTLLETLDLVMIMIHPREKGRSARRVKEIVEIERIEPETGKAQLTKVFVWDPINDRFEFTGALHLLNKISEEKGISMENIMKEIELRKRVIDWLCRQELDWQGVSNYIEMYYHDKTSVLKAMK